MLKEFRKLTKEEKQEIRKSYRSNCFKEYRYSINLFILYVFVGIFSLFSLLLMVFVRKIFLILFLFSLIILIIVFKIYQNSVQKFTDYVKEYLNEKNNC